MKKDKRAAALALIQYISASPKVKRFAFARPSLGLRTVFVRKTWRYVVIAFWAYTVTTVAAMAAITYLPVIDSERAEGYAQYILASPKAHMVRPSWRYALVPVAYTEPYITQLEAWIVADESIYTRADDASYMLLYEPEAAYGEYIEPPQQLTSNLRATYQQLTDEETDILHGIVWAEARGESLKGQILVVNVILNRLADPAFPDTIRDVVLAPRQFAPIRNGSFDRAVPGEMQFEAVRLALEGVDYSRGALYFRAMCHCLYGSWHERALKPLFDYGVHRFYQ